MNNESPQRDAADQVQCRNAIKQPHSLANLRRQGGVSQGNDHYPRPSVGGEASALACIPTEAVHTYLQMTRANQQRTRRPFGRLISVGLGTRRDVRWKAVPLSNHLDGHFKILDALLGSEGHSFLYGNST